MLIWAPEENALIPCNNPIRRRRLLVGTQYRNITIRSPRILGCGHCTRSEINPACHIAVRLDAMTLVPDAANSRGRQSFHRLRKLSSSSSSGRARGRCATALTVSEAFTHRTSPKEIVKFWCLVWPLTDFAPIATASRLEHESVSSFSFDGNFRGCGYPL